VQQEQLLQDVFELTFFFSAFPSSFLSQGLELQQGELDDFSLSLDFTDLSFGHACFAEEQHDEDFMYGQPELPLPSLLCSANSDIVTTRVATTINDKVIIFFDFILLLLLD